MSLEIQYKESIGEKSCYACLNRISNIEKWIVTTEAKVPPNIITASAIVRPGLSNGGRKGVVGQ
jgi:hypothetical protein